MIDTTNVGKFLHFFFKKLSSVNDLKKKKEKVKRVFPYLQCTYNSCDNCISYMHTYIRVTISDAFTETYYLFTFLYYYYSHISLFFSSSCKPFNSTLLERVYILVFK